jgi:hypothetical protein
MLRDDETPRRPFFARHKFLRARGPAGDMKTRALLLKDKIFKVLSEIWS